MLLKLKGGLGEPEQVNHNYIVPSVVMKGTGEQVTCYLTKQSKIFQNMRLWGQVGRIFYVILRPL